MKSRREELYEKAVDRYRRTRERAHPGRTGDTPSIHEAADRYTDWALAWWQAIQRAFPGDA